MAAHPRSRGEHAAATAAKWLKDGSSPLARGTFTGTLEELARERLIPARAGNILTGLSVRTVRAAHPRSRGEHRTDSAHSSSALGSSPLARGTSVYASLDMTSQRLIPARAGNIAARSQPQRPASAHPRSRGEHATKHTSRSPATGSSPLARGTSLHKWRP